MRTGGDLAKAIACGADMIMIGSPLSRSKEAPGRGYHWGMATFHPELPRGARVKTDVVASLEEILIGPAHENDGTLNLCGALRTSMATCGYLNIKEFQSRNHGCTINKNRGQVPSAVPENRYGLMENILVVDFGGQYSQLIAKGSGAEGIF